MNAKLFAVSLVMLTSVIIFCYIYIPDNRFGQTQPFNSTSGQATPTGQSATPSIELVFALDTTGSMDGLIEAAKEKIWSIASSMANTKPAPHIKIGLVAYRDQGDDYITHIIPLSDNLDMVYAQLLELEAAGGGDTPESVNTALSDALQRMNWSQNQSDFKTIFLIGDAPGHQNSPTEIPFQHSLKLANELGIIVNTIQAGNDPVTHNQWLTIARLGGGAKFQVGQRGSSVAISTPFDDAIALASQELDDTRLYFGDAAILRQTKNLSEQRKKVYRESSSAALARRAKYQETASGKNSLDEKHDLVTQIAEQQTTLQEISPESLPQALKPLTQQEQLAVIEHKANQRAEISARLNRLNKQRDSYIAQQLASQVDLDKSLDNQLLSTLQAQAKPKGFNYQADKLDY